MLVAKTGKAAAEGATAFPTQNAFLLAIKSYDKHLHVSSPKSVNITDCHVKTADRRKG